MRRHLAASCALTAAVLLTACTGGESETAPPAEAPNPPAVTATPEASPTPTESAATPVEPTPAASESVAAGTTDPAKLDGALLKPEQLPGWERADDANEPVPATADPEPCAAIYQQTVGKVASDFGATAAYTKDSLFLQEFIDLVDNGSQSISDIEKTVGQCQSFSVDEGGEMTKFTATPMAVPALGDKAYGLRLGVDGADKAELLYVWVAYKDTVMTMHIDGEKVDEKLLTDTAAQATDTLKATI
ncbi:hypothetical protein [Enemella evansiae]|uniref:Lipoprotein n=1 Tax=Enemella evansiae TaxID=2016499 RepID=A0A255GTQ2_9ACTN|nr:hypothetical protein [Enemella evansiae]OYO09331.1 hypothetical protein BI335_18520 [Enemella evansiae]OYO17903.1 hypothetical protein CGZ94_03315 [Enemella evansiae]TDO89959.1 hypothetical protein C8D81_2849 [Enemella evansiae]